MLTTEAEATSKPLLFGANIDPIAADPEEAVARAQLAEAAGYDLALMQDHPYNATHLDTWTVLGAIAARTDRIVVGSNVSPLPLRPPVMLAKAIATLNVLTHGRVILGLGAGGFPEYISVFGGPALTSRESVAALYEGIRLIRRLWSDERSTTFQGTAYHVRGARFGPKPIIPIPIWIGAIQPRMLRLTGRLADGVSVSAPYIGPDRLPSINAFIDEGAIAAGRSPAAVRRAYNLMGDIVAGTSGDSGPVGTGGRYTIDAWIRGMTDYAIHGRIDSFTFWPNHDRHTQFQLFAAEVMPAVRDAVAARGGS